MPESEFLSLFTKTSSWTDPEYAYITKQKKSGAKSYYIFSGCLGSDPLCIYRITFENGGLIKFEGHGIGGKIPFGYTDDTIWLRKTPQK